MNALAARVDRWLFAPEPAGRVRALRTGVAALLALRCAIGPYARLGGQPPALFRPVWFLTWLDGMPSHDVLLGLQVAGAVTGILAVLGRLERLSFPVATACLLVLEACLASRGKVQHNALPLLLVACVLAVAPVGARLVDRRRSAVWGWPVRTTIAVVCGTYVLTGLQKVVSSGPAWVLSDNLRNVMYAAPLSDHAPTDSVSRAIADRAWLSHLVALATVAIELGGAVALVWVRARVGYVVAVTVLHAGVWLTHGLDYSLWVATVALVLVDWSAVADGWRARRAPGSAPGRDGTSLP